jgi:predicted amidohydrolase YtcJ
MLLSFLSRGRAGNNREPIIKYKPKEASMMTQKDKRGGHKRGWTAPVLFIVVQLFVAIYAGRAVAQNIPPELIRYADLVLYNGKVLTVDKNFTVADAVAVRDGKILAVGSNGAIQQLAGPTTQRIDLQGRSVVPGAVDSDGDNAFAGGDLYKDTMVNGKVGKKIRGKNVAEMLDKVNQLVAEAKPGTPVFCRMADEFVTELSKLTAKDLDKIAPNNPIILSLSSSEGVANTAMLEKAFSAGLRREHFQVVKDKNGRPTGQLFSQALGFIGWNLRDWPELTEETFKEQEQIVDDFLRAGVTTVTGHASGYTVTIVSQMFHQGRLKMRIRPDVDFARQNPMADQFLRRTPNLVNFGLGDGMVRIVGAAIGPVDGASDDGGILTNEPKAKTHPEVGGGPFGRNKWTGPEWTGKQWSDLTEADKRDTEWNTFVLLRKHGWNIGGNHNMGSGAASIIMEALLDAEKQPEIKVSNMLARNALDHNLIWDKKSLSLAKQLGDKMAFGLNSEIWSQRVVRGEEMVFSQYGESMHTMQPVKELVQAGLNVHFEGGKPEQSPLWRIERFVTRADKSTRSAHSGRIWGKGQAIDRKQALRMVTLNAAKFISEENMLGSIEKNKYADLVVLNGDYMSVPDDRLDELLVDMTIVGGKVAFQREKNK